MGGIPMASGHASQQSKKQARRFRIIGSNHRDAPGGDRRR